MRRGETVSKKFEELDREYDAAQEAWGKHVDNCPTCKKSIYRCEEHRILSERQNAAWNAARRAWLKLTDAEKAAYH
jgi:hypothetical protein